MFKKKQNGDFLKPKILVFHKNEIAIKQRRNGDLNLKYIIKFANQNIYNMTLYLI